MHRSTFLSHIPPDYAIKNIESNYIWFYRLPQSRREKLSTIFEELRRQSGNSSTHSSNNNIILISNNVVSTLSTATFVHHWCLSRRKILFFFFQFSSRHAKRLSLFRRRGLKDQRRRGREGSLTPSSWLNCPDSCASPFVSVLPCLYRWQKSLFARFRVPPSKKKRMCRFTVEYKETISLLEDKNRREVKKLLSWRLFFPPSLSNVHKFDSPYTYLAGQRARLRIIR